MNNAGIPDDGLCRLKYRHLLERANATRMEQEDEDRKLNELILNVQRHLVRDAQILESWRILEELQVEERRLDAMREPDRRRALEAQEQNADLRKQQRIQEKQLILKHLENLEKIQQERHAKLRAMKHTYQKMEREVEYLAEQRRIKREKEEEVAGPRAQQERDRDHKAEQDELQAWGNQEADEEVWQKLVHNEHLLLIEAGRERAEIEGLLRARQASIEKEKEDVARRRQTALRHADGVHQQAREHELKAVVQCREIFKEGSRLDEEVHQRRVRLDESEKTLTEMKNKLEVLQRSGEELSQLAHLLADEPSSLPSARSH